MGKAKKLTKEEYRISVKTNRWAMAMCVKSLHQHADEVKDMVGCKAAQCGIDQLVEYFADQMSKESAYVKETADRNSKQWRRDLAEELADY